MMGSNPSSYVNGFPSMTSAVLCAKASMLLQVKTQLFLESFVNLYSHCKTRNSCPFLVWENFSAFAFLLLNTDDKRKMNLVALSSEDNFIILQNKEDQ